MGVVQIPEQLVPIDQQVGEDLGVSGGPLELAVLPLPLPAPWGLGNRGRLPSCLHGAWVQQAISSASTSAGA